MYLGCNLITWHRTLPEHSKGDTCQMLAMAICNYYYDHLITYILRLSVVHALFFFGFPEHPLCLLEPVRFLALSFSWCDL